MGFAMIRHADLNILWLDPDNEKNTRSLAKYLDAMAHVRVITHPGFSADGSEFNAVVTPGRFTDPSMAPALADFVERGGQLLLFVDRRTTNLPAFCGAQLRPAGPHTELRVLFDNSDHPIAARLPDAFYVTTDYRAFVPADDETKTLLYTDWHYTHKPVLVSRKWGRGQVSCTTLPMDGHPVLHRIFYRILNDTVSQSNPRAEIGVGLLGYAPSVGRGHGLGVQKTAGLTLRACCDLNPNRLETAHRDFPDIHTTVSAAEFAENDDVDLVIIATPPNTHCRLTLDMLAAGKHVVCEKPLALDSRQTAQMAAAAAKADLHLSCHQNRRWDPDYVAIKAALAAGRIGELFYLETFVGGFHHPCGYWHSDMTVSGGAAYDWGAHYLDWIVGLMPQPIAAVTGTRHKRVWHDVTNNDQERIQIRFTDGAEAEFIHSDIAAARKPKWYLLGTRGAICGHWRDVAAYTPDSLHYFQQYDIPATEMPPHLVVHHRDKDGHFTAHEPALPPRVPWAFHRNLADHLLLGEPLGAPLADSIKVVHILEAAARSAANHGKPEVINV